MFRAAQLQQSTPPALSLSGGKNQLWKMQNSLLQTGNAKKNPQGNENDWTRDVIDQSGYEYLSFF